MSTFKSGAIVISPKATTVTPSLSGEISVVARDTHLYAYNGSIEQQITYTSEVSSISGNLQSQITSISGSLSTYTLLSTTQSISGNLQNQINLKANSSDLSNYTLLTTTQSISAGLDSRITTINTNYATKATPISGTYNTVVVNSQGIVTSGGNVSYLTPDALNAYVPYTGATSGVNLGTHKLTSDAISFNISPITPIAPRQISWNEVEKTFDMGLTSDVTLQVGQETITRVYNGTALTITNGQPVYITGITNDNPSVGLAGATLLGDGTLCAGIATEAIAPSGAGFITNKGKIRGVNTSGYTTGQTIYLGETPGTFTTQTSGFAFKSHINPIGYIGLVDAISGSVYVNVRNESSLLSLSERETNVVLGNVISTGVYESSAITQATSASFTVPPVKGWIVTNTGVYATAPEVTNVVFAGGTYPVTNILTQTQTFILLNSSGTIVQIPNFPTATQRREMIFLGKIAHNNLSTINAINNTADYDTSSFSALRDMFAPINILNGGVTISPNGTNKSIARNAGTIYGLGINWANSQTAPNTIDLSGQPLVTIRSYVTRSTLIASNQTLIDPANYDLNGTLTAVGGGANASSNQRVYQFPNGNIVVQYGQTTYANLAAAVAGIATESFVPYPNTIQSAVLIAYISLVKTASDLSNTSRCIITPGGLFGQPTGGTSNISTGTLQQAYDNSVTPEIVINSTIDGLTIKNGTGNADTVTHLLEGQNTAGLVTSFIMADGNGYFTGLTASNISGSSGSIVTHDANGMLLNSGILATSLASTSTVASISAGLDSRITTINNNYATKATPISGTYNTVIVNSQGIITSGGNVNYSVDLTPYTPLTTTQSISAGLNSRIVTNTNNISNISGSLSNYTPLTTTSSISAGLNTRIGTLEEIVTKTGEPRGFENKTSSTLSFNESTLTFNISGSFNIWQNGVKIAKTSDTQVIANTTGTHYLYYNASGVFTYSMTVWDILVDVPIAMIYWNATNSKGILVEERHGIIMDSVTHKYLHLTKGTQLISVGALGIPGGLAQNPATLSGQQITLGASTIADEDLISTSTILSGGSYVTLSRLGATSWNIRESLTLPYIIGITNNLITYNQFVSPNWQVTELDVNNTYVNYYVINVPATATKYQNILIPGQATYSSLSLAQGESLSNLDLTGIPFSEMCAIYRLTYRYNSTYATATGKARLEAVASINYNTITTGITPASNHNSLSGLQGGTTGEYYHMTSAQDADWIGASSVANISGDLDSRITTINTNYATKATPISGTYNTVVVNSQGIITSGGNVSYITSSSLTPYTLLTTTQSISGSLLNGVSASLTYDISGNLSTYTSVKGTKVFTYSIGLLVSISGSGEYRSKTLSYSGNILQSITVI